jgi:putative hydrolase of the HAD superfamily
VANDLDLVLFDLGGVLIELGGVDSLQEMASIVGDEELWEKWLTSPWVRRFERGECSPIDFSTGFVAEWQLDVSPERFLDIFRDWPVGPMAGSHELLIEVQAEVPIGCLSNTNTMHWDYQFSRWPILSQFDHRFLSFELGLVKPDAAVFGAVVDGASVTPDRVFFLDDNIINIDAARAFGFQAVRVRGIGEAREALAAAGVISG